MGVALPLTILLAILSVAVPLTVEPSKEVLFVLWSLAFLSAVWTMASIPAVSDRIWKLVADRVSNRLSQEQPANESIGNGNWSRQFHGCLQQVMGELEECRATIVSSVADKEFWYEQLPNHEWRRCSNTLAAQQGASRLNKALREAYREIERLEKEASIPHPDWEGPTISGNPFDEGFEYSEPRRRNIPSRRQFGIYKTLDAIEAALRELETEAARP